MQHARERVLAVTGIRENDLNDMILDSAYEWVAMITHNDARAIQFIPKTTQFWSFWRKAWHKVDTVFLMLDDKMGLGNSAVEVYRSMHRISRDNYYVNNRAMQAHYHFLRSMITYVKP